MRAFLVCFMFCLFANSGHALPVLIPPPAIVQCGSALTFVKNSSSPSSRSTSTVRSSPAPSFNYSQPARPVGSLSGTGTARLAPFSAATSRRSSDTISDPTTARQAPPSAAAVLSPALRDYTIRQSGNPPPASPQPPPRRFLDSPPSTYQRDYPAQSPPPARTSVPRTGFPSLRYSAPQPAAPDMSAPHPSRLSRVMTLGKAAYAKYKVWHRNSQNGQTNLRSANSNYTDHYTGGEVGNPFVLAQADWIVASLRLEPGTTTAMPQTPIVPVLPMSSDEFSNRDKQISNGLAALTSQTQNLARQIKDGEDAQQSEAQLSSVRDEFTREIREASSEFQDAGSRLSQSHAEVLKDADDLKEARASSFLCHIHLFCGWATSSESNALSEAQKNEARDQASLDQARSRRDDREHKLGEVSDRLTAATARQVDPTVLANFKSQRDSLREQTQNLLNERRSLVGFVNEFPGQRQISDSFKSCARPLRYHAGAANDANFRHPFFNSNVSQSLQPDDSAELFVCADNNNRVQSVHIIANGREILQSEVVSTDSNQVEDVQIRDADGRVLEEHQWQKLDNGRIRYGQSFVRTNDANETPTSVYADQFE